MALTNQSHRLGCGRDIDDVWASIDRPPDAHEQSCAECQAARASLAELAAATEALQDRDDAELNAGPELIGRILDIARSEVRRGRRLPLVRGAADEPVDLSVAEQAVATVVRGVGDRMPGVQIRRCAVLPVVGDVPPIAGPVTDGEPQGAGERVDASVDEAVLAAPAEVVVELRVSVDGRTPIRPVIAELRERVMDVVEDEVGLVVERVDVVVEDVHDA